MSASVETIPAMIMKDVQAGFEEVLRAFWLGGSSRARTYFSLRAARR
jgi:hypothetical protein